MEPVIKGHPIHATIIPLAIGTLPASYLLDLAALTTDNEKLADAAYYTMLIGAGGAIPAAISGLWDYLSMAKNDPAQKTAITHGALNAGMVTLYTVNLLIRTQNRRSKLGFALSSVGAAGLLVSGYLGGEIAYGRGWRVRPAERFELKWQKERQVGPFAGNAGPQTTDQDFPPEVIKGLHEKKGSSEIFEEIKSSTAREATTMSTNQPGSTSHSDDQKGQSSKATSASDLADKQNGSGTQLQQEDRPSQAEGDRETVEEDLKENSQA